MKTGKCLCGKIEVKILETPKNFGVCHCDSCRRWTGGVFMSFSGGKDLVFSNEELVGRFESSKWAERGFCKNCGTSLFFKMKKSNHYFLMLGLFGSEISPKFDEQQFIDEKPECYSFLEETKLVTKAEMNDALNAFLSNQ